VLCMRCGRLSEFPVTDHQKHEGRGITESMTTGPLEPKIERDGSVSTHYCAVKVIGVHVRPAAWHAFHFVACGLWRHG